MNVIYHHQCFFSPLNTWTSSFSSFILPSSGEDLQILGVRRRVAERQNMDGQDSEDSKQSTADMTVFVQNLLTQMQSRFQAMSESIVSKNILYLEGLGFFNCNVLDEMGERIDELEHSINELKSEMGTEGSPSPLAPTKTKPEDSKPAVGTP
ncbi:hypothetical protein NE237_014481 [Protea cynaroides]|uniref:Heat shock factor binding protein 1 n=1 Tax=Protea cynaroides TaxID=273540 RepID=A0A9Q0QQ18_9MAGN|nr:hypothetical protein NE237_014481 [Protea cynaroides]